MAWLDSRFWITFDRVSGSNEHAFYKALDVIAFPDFYFFWRIVGKLGKIENCCTTGLARIRGIRILRPAFTFLLRSIGASFRAGCDIFVIVALLFSFMDVVVSGTELMKGLWSEVRKCHDGKFRMCLFIVWTRISDNNRITNGETNFINLIKHFFLYLFQVSRQCLEQVDSLIKIKGRRVSEFRF